MRKAGAGPHLSRSLTRWLGCAAHLRTPIAHLVLMLDAVRHRDILHFGVKCWVDDLRTAPNVPSPGFGACCSVCCCLLTWPRGGQSLTPYLVLYAAVVLVDLL